MPDSWTDTTPPRERLEAIATTIHDPKPIEYIADAARVEPDTAQQHVDELVRTGTLLETSDDEYVPDPVTLFFDELRTLTLTNTKPELQAQLDAVTTHIDTSEARFDADTPAELDATIPDDHPPDNENDVERWVTLTQWRDDLHTKHMLETALHVYDDVHGLAEQVPATLPEHTDENDDGHRSIDDAPPIPSDPDTDRPATDMLREKREEDRAERDSEFSSDE